jgi:hypothetical protein
MTIKNCAATAGIDGADDLNTVIATLKGCPTGMVTLLSEEQGGPAGYSWSKPSLGSDVGNLLLLGPSPTGKEKGMRLSKKDKAARKEGDEGDASKKNPDSQFSPLVTIELGGEGPFRTGPWAASNVAFQPSSTQPLVGVPFQTTDGHADMREVSFEGFNGTLFRVTEATVLNVEAGTFLGNGGKDATGDNVLVDVVGGSFYCHRCHYENNTGVKLIRTTGPDALVGLSFSRFLQNQATGALVEAVDGSRGGFASTSFVNNTVENGAILNLREHSVFVGQNSLFKSNVGGDLMAHDAHYRVDKSWFTQSTLGMPEVRNRAEEILLKPVGLTPVEGEGEVEGGLEGGEEEGKRNGTDADVEEAPSSQVDSIRRSVQDLATIFFGPPVGKTGGKVPPMEGSVARLYGQSTFQGINLFVDHAESPAVVTQDASNITLGRPCFMHDAPAQGERKAEARFVEATAASGDLVLWGACAFPSFSEAAGERGGPDVFVADMGEERVALTPYTNLSIGGQTHGIVPAQNGSCLRQCEASSAPPLDWDPSARPSAATSKGQNGAKLFPSGITIIFSDGQGGSASSASSILPPPPVSFPQPPSDVNFDEQTGMINVKYPDEYKGEKIPSFQLPFGIPFVITSSSSSSSFSSSSHTTSSGRKGEKSRGSSKPDGSRRRSLLRGGRPNGPLTSLFDRILDTFEILRSTHTPHPPPNTKRTDSPRDHSLHTDQKPLSSFPTATSPSEGPDAIFQHAAASGLVHEEDMEELKWLLPSGNQPEIPPEVYVVNPPFLSIPPLGLDTVVGEEEEAGADGAEAKLLDQLYGDRSAPWENSRGEDAWLRPDWTFLDQFPVIANVPAVQASGTNKQALKAARSYQAYLNFLASNPGVALPFSAGAIGGNGTEGELSGPEAEAPSPGIAVGETNPATPPPTTHEQNHSGNGLTRPCPEGEAPLVLYLDSGSLGEHEACQTDDTGSQDGFYFRATSGKHVARTLPLPHMDPASAPADFTLLQILDLGCQPPTNILEIELRNEEIPDVVCARWTLTDWAGTLEKAGTSVTLETENKTEDDGKEKEGKGLPATGIAVGEFNPAAPVVTPTKENGVEAGTEGGKEAGSLPQGIAVGEFNPSMPVIKEGDGAGNEDLVEHVMGPGIRVPVQGIAVGEYNPSAFSEMEREEQGGVKPEGGTQRRDEVEAGRARRVETREPPVEGEGKPKISAADVEEELLSSLNTSLTSTTSPTSSSTTLLTVPLELGEPSGNSFISMVILSDPNMLNESVVFSVYLPGLQQLNGTVPLPAHVPSLIKAEEIEGKIGTGGLEGQVLNDAKTDLQTHTEGERAKPGRSLEATVGAVTGALVAVACIFGAVMYYKRRRGQGNVFMTDSGLY